MNTPSRFLRAVLVTVGLCSSFAFSQQQLLNIRQEDRGGPKEGSKINLFYRISRYSFAAGTVTDGVTTGLALKHPTIASTRSGIFLARYSPVETGFPARYVSRTNPFAIGATNAATNAGVAFLSDRLYRHGGRWGRIAAIAINVGGTAWTTRCAIHNMRQGAFAERQIRASTGYRGAIVWSH
jgi:hypothetical protein